MAVSIRVVGISGSLRKNSYNTSALKAAKELMPEGMTMEFADISQLPLYNQDVEASGVPEIILQFREQIRNAHALVIASPEYNYSIPGGLKNAIDWASRPPKENALNGKTLAIIGASTGMLGTARMQYHLRQVAVFTNMFPVNKPEVFITKATEKFDKDGKLTDEITRKLIGDLLISLRDWTQRLGIV